MIRVPAWMLKTPFPSFTCIGTGTILTEPAIRLFTNESIIKLIIISLPDDFMVAYFI
jgi:hypothetical protein